MNIAIVGSREFANIEYYQQTFSYHDSLMKYEEDYNKVLDYLTSLEEFNNDTTIVSGGAKGADSLAEEIADKFELKKIIIKPQWNVFGKKAGMVRNEEIVDTSDIIVALWNGKSRGTKNTISLARRKNKQVYIYFVK